MVETEPVPHPLKSFYSRFAKNSILYFCSQVAGKGLFFFITVYLARLLGAQNYGKFAFSFGLVTLLSVISKFGLDLLTSRDVGEKPELAEKYLHGAFTLRLILSTLFLLFIFLIIFVIGKPSEINRLIVFLAIAACFQSVAGAGTALFEGLQLFGSRSFLNVCMYGFILVVLIIATWPHGSFEAIGPAFLIGASAYFLTTMMLAHSRIGRVKLSFDSHFVWNLFRMAVPLGLTEVFIGIYYRVDTVLLSLFDTDTIVGWYDAAYTFVYVLRLLPVTAALVLLPSLSGVFAKSEKEGKEIYRTAIRVSIAAGFLVTFLIAVNSEFVVSLVFGKDYGPSADVLKLLIWTCAIMFANAFQGIFLVIVQQRGAFFRATALGAISNLILNLYLIPKWSMHGAAVATVLSEFFVFLACSVYLRKFVDAIAYLKILIVPIIGLALMAILWIFWGSTHFIAGNLVCIFSYLGIIWFFWKRRGERRL
jgi:O-antigen/teichoic acid export membrane protein